MTRTLTLRPGKEDVDLSAYMDRSLAPMVDAAGLVPDTFSVGSASTFAQTASVLRIVRGHRDQAEADLASFVGPLEAVVKRIKARFKPGIAELIRAESALKAGLAAWYSTAPARVLALVDEGADASDAHAPEVEGLQFRETSTVVVTDIDALPLAYVKRTPDKRALATALKNGDKIPGAHLDTKTSVAIVG